MAEQPQEGNAEARDVETSWVEAQRRGKPFRDADGTISYPSYRTRPKPDSTLDPFHRGLLTASVAAAVHPAVSSFSAPMHGLSAHASPGPGMHGQKAHA